MEALRKWISSVRERVAEGLRGATKAGAKRGVQPVRFRKLVSRPAGTKITVLDSKPPGELAATAILRAMLEDRQAQRQNSILRGAIYFLMFVIPMLIYAAIYAHAAGVRLAPGGDVVGVVRVDGQIAAGSLASADRIIPALRDAFESRRVQAVVLSIDSPGGSPVEAERIYRMIEAYKQSHPKPVVAVINNIGASAAFMIALHCDTIVAGDYSLVGSIGAIMSGWDLHRAIDRLDVAQRVYASGALKSMLDPFLPMSTEADEKAKDLVMQMGRQFVADLNATRGAKLKPDVDYGTGEVWGGSEALNLGLVDERGTLDEYVQRRWGYAIRDFGPRRGGFGFSALVTDVVRQMVQGETVSGPGLR